MDDDLSRIGISLPKHLLDRFDEILKVTHHDVTAFLNTVAESLGEESRFIHLGLTSSDVLDTALALQMVEATDLLLSGMDAFLAVLREQTETYAALAMVGRTHGIHAEPTTFGLKLAGWYDAWSRRRETLDRAGRVAAVGANVRSFKPGDVVTLVVKRGAATIEVEVTLEAGGGGGR